MATPLRKEHPESDDEQEITTADLAQGKRPVSETRGPHTVTTERNLEQASRTDTATTFAGNEDRTDARTNLFPSAELEGLRTRWKEIQTAFVDEPRKAVEQADGLVASAMKRLAEVFELLDRSGHRYLMTGSGESRRILVLRPVLQEQTCVDCLEQLGQSAPCSRAHAYRRSDVRLVRCEI